MYQLILASESPRRKDLLEKAGFFFHVFSVKVSESLEKNLTVDEQILAIARRKADASLKSYKANENQEFVVLAADTMVVVDGDPMGKPLDEGQAFDYLTLLSGRSHQVKTAVVMKDLNMRQFEGIQTTDVTFRHLSEREIEEYILSGEPMDKAGAYGIQGLAGQFVSKITGPFDNVVGLPMELVKKLLNDGGWKLKNL